MQRNRLGQTGAIKRFLRLVRRECRLYLLGHSSRIMLNANGEKVNTNVAEVVKTFGGSNVAERLSLIHI